MNDHSFMSSYISFAAIAVIDFLLISSSGQANSSDNSNTFTNPLNMEKMGEPVWLGIELFEFYRSRLFL